MATGKFWNVNKPDEPWGLFDAGAILVFPLDISDWLDGWGATYASHTVTAPLPLECVDPGTHSAGVIPVRIRVAAGAEFSYGKKYPFTLRVVTADNQQDDRTLWLSIRET